ncbi:MAG TPA: hypothetical protein VME44_25215 [Streptosporangiaceae bacterium]|nr:hypothetical protein [Streptosporangiaceae bacterium]
MGDPLKLTSSEIFAAAVVAGPLLLGADELELDPPWAGAPLPGAAVLPQAAASNAHAPAAAQRDASRAEWDSARGSCAFGVMAIGRALLLVGSRALAHLP